MEATDKQIAYLKRLTQMIESLRTSYQHTLAYLPRFVNWDTIPYITTSEASVQINRYKLIIKEATIKVKKR